MANNSQQSKVILVTGGAGYIGSFTVLDLLKSGFEVIVVDNLSNASEKVFNRLEQLSGKTVKFYQTDVTDQAGLDKVFVDNPGIHAVIHFAALKAVAESRIIPLEYYHNNVGGTITLLRCMVRHGVHRLIYSSSATVYGDATRFENMIPIPEECPLEAVQPYGQTKIMSEQIIQDCCKTNPQFRAGLLRYFNPVGAHPSGLIGEDPRGIPNNLLPLVAQVANKKRPMLTVFGKDFETPDGTPIRDYLHVVDLAAGHLSALERIEHLPQTQNCRVWNLGTGRGATVLEVIRTFEKATGVQIPYEVGGRRLGDVVNLTAKVDRAEKELHWKAKLTLEQACRDLWKWASENPDGY